MKKMCTLLVLAFAASLLVIACDDSSDTSLKWTRADGDSATLSTIKWMSAGSADQTWSGSYRTGDSTDSKTVTQTTGNGEGVDDGGTAYNLLIGTSSSVTLSEKTDNTLTISQIQAK